MGTGRWCGGDRGDVAGPCRRWVSCPDRDDEWSDRRLRWSRAVSEGHGRRYIDTARAPGGVGSAGRFAGGLRGGLSAVRRGSRCVRVASVRGRGPAGLADRSRRSHHGAPWGACVRRYGTVGLDGAGLGVRVSQPSGLRVQHAKRRSTSPNWPRDVVEQIAEYRSQSSGQEGRHQAIHMCRRQGGGHLVQALPEDGGGTKSLIQETLVDVL